MLRSTQCFSLPPLAGYFADKTQRYWLIVLIGYTINLLAVPALALTGKWPITAALIVAERIGRALRKPVVDAMFSYAGKTIGRGWVFGLNEGLDQSLTLASDPSKYLVRRIPFLMQHDPKDNNSDSMLAPFLTAKSESISDELLRAIIDEHADPIIKKILRSKLRVSLNGVGTQQNQDALEIAGDLQASIISTLRALRQNPNQTAIANFADFVIIKTYSACADYFREKHPQRWRLKSLLRRRLRQNPRFTLWQAEDKRWYAGFSGRQETGSEAEEPGATESVTHPTDGKLSAAQMKSDEFLGALFERSGRPIVFDEVVKIAAETWHIHDPPAESIDTGGAERDEQFTSSEPRVDLALEQRLFFEQVWFEVCQLPVLQCAALLLNLRDSRDGGVISFLPFLGVASKEELARLLEMPYADFQKLWNELPLDDLRIAQMFGITRQQVINLRKTARERLARKMRKLEEK